MMTVTPLGTQISVTVHKKHVMVLLYVIGVTITAMGCSSVPYLLQGVFGGGRGGRGRRRRDCRVHVGRLAAVAGRGGDRGAVPLIHEHVVQHGLGALRFVVVVEGADGLEKRERERVSKNMEINPVALMES